LVATRWVSTMAIIWHNWHSGGIFTLRYKPYRLFTGHHSVLCASCMHLTEQLTPRSLEWSPESLTSDNYVIWNMPGAGHCLIRCLWGIWVRPVGRGKISEGAAKWAQWLVPGRFHNVMVFMICTCGFLQQACGFWTMVRSGRPKKTCSFVPCKGTQKRHRKRHMKIITHTLRLGVADYVIFLITLYDIIFQWWWCTHN
jgi:hypothetical protein